MATAASPYLRHRFPPEIIAHCVLLSIRFPLSLRAVEEMMLLRGVQVSYETIRRWRQKFGQQCAARVTPARGDVVRRIPLTPGAAPPAGRGGERGHVLSGYQRAPSHSSAWPRPPDVVRAPLAVAGLGRATTRYRPGTTRGALGVSGLAPRSARALTAICWARVSARGAGTPSLSRPHIHWIEPVANTLAPLTAV